MQLYETTHEIRILGMSRCFGGVKMILYFIVMSIALSIDALGIGISYRLKGVTIPFRTKISIGVMTSGIMLGALLFGNIIHKGLPVQVSKTLGAVVLIVIGAVFIHNSLYQDEEITYDFNHSREIELLEGVLLAVALSADSIGAGIAVASSGPCSCFFGIMVGGVQLFFLFLADFFVNHIKMIRKFNNKICGIISGAMLVIIGLLRCFS